MRTKPKHKYSTKEEKYIRLSEVYLSKYEDQKSRHVKMLMAKGIIVEMESDLAFFHINNPRTEKSDNQLLRLNMLREIVDEFAAIHAFNYQVNLVLGTMHRENNDLKETIKSLMAKDDGTD